MSVCWGPNRGISGTRWRYPIKTAAGIRFQLRAKLQIASRGVSATLKPVPDTIEAEVLEIDGGPLPPPEVRNDRSRGQASRSWESLRGKVVRLDRRWWPLWVLLGILAVALLLTVGMVLAVVVAIAKLVGGILRFLTGGSPERSGAGLSRRA